MEDYWDMLPFSSNRVFPIVYFEPYYDTTLMQAASVGDVKRVKLLLYSEPPWLKNIIGWNALMYASHKGHLEVAKILIKANSSLNTMDFSGNTPLIAAIDGGHLEMVNLLMKVGAEYNTVNRECTDCLFGKYLFKNKACDKYLYGNTIFNTRYPRGIAPPKEIISKKEKDDDEEYYDDKKFDQASSNEQVENFITNCYRWSPLSLAVGDGQIDIVKLLLIAGADVDVENSSNETPLLIAAYEGWVDSVKILIEVGANINQKNVFGISPLALAVSQGYIEVVNDLIERNADINIETEEKLTPLIIASFNGFIDLVKFLLYSGAHIEAKDKEGNTSLMHAVASCHFDISTCLIENGANVNTKNIMDQNALMYAAKNGNFIITSQLIQAGSHINEIDKNGDTALAHATSGGHLNVMKLLLEQGADVNLTGSRIPPLLIAININHIPSVDLLMKFRANVNAQLFTIESILILAARINMDIFKMLLRAGVRLKKTDLFGYHPIHQLIAERRMEALELMRRSGVDMNLEIHRQYTPLYLAVQKGDLEMVECLVRLGAMIDFKKKNETPLKLAIALNHQNISQYLIRKLVYCIPSMTKPFYVSNVGHVSNYWDQCVHEVRGMQTCILGFSSVTVRQCMLEIDIDKLAGYLSNQTFDRPVEELYKPYFPIYLNDIAETFNIGLKRRAYREKAQLVLRHSDADDLPEDITTLITFLISNTDLDNLIQSALI